MASIIWNRDPQEAIKNPYEYNAQKQFHREALILTEKLGNKLTNYLEFKLEDKSLEKATWMLQTDALFAFRDCISLLDQKRHRVVGRLLRDIFESIHLIEYLNSDSEKAKKSLNDWFDDKLIMHREYREYVKIISGEDLAAKQRNNHRELSKFTHRSYNILLYGYANVDERLFYDEEWTLPQSISMYYAYLGIFGQFIIRNLKFYGILESAEIENIWKDSMEDFQIPMGYLSEEDKEFLGINLE